MDPKIELRKLFALHEASIRLDHAIREVTDHAWLGFSPTRFIYAFFTFNSIYSFDWERSFAEKKAITWSTSGAEKIPREEEQQKSYLNFTRTTLNAEGSGLFSKQLKKQLALYNIADPKTHLDKVSVSNATNKVKNLASQLAGQFNKLLDGKASSADFFASSCAVFKFIYSVRCNIFHGSKTMVQMLDKEQQQRLLIYTAALVAVNSLLFTIAARADIAWKPVTVDFGLTTTNPKP